mmetsp:Transcript_16821/g.52228  ORF Transcript_16821/g.52228 Transcript_16821/m.52228 type:complete len:251 (-) Transcript_16821:783-1535(-)
MALCNSALSAARFASRSRFAAAADACAASASARPFATGSSCNSRAAASGRTATSPGGSPPTAVGRFCFSCSTCGDGSILRALFAFICPSGGVRGGAGPWGVGGSSSSTDIRGGGVLPCAAAEGGVAPPSSSYRRRKDSISSNSRCFHFTQSFSGPAASTSSSLVLRTAPAPFALTGREDRGPSLSSVAGEVCRRPRRCAALGPSSPDVPSPSPSFFSLPDDEFSAAMLRNCFCTSSTALRDISPSTSCTL